MTAVPALAPYRNKMKWIAAAVVALSLFSLLMQDSSTANSWQSSIQSPLTISIPTLAFRTNAPGRLIGLALTIITLGAIFVTQRHRDNENESSSRELDWPLLLVSLSAGLLTLLPANLATLAITWTVLDIVTAAIWILAIENPRDALVHWGAGAVGILSLWCAILPLQATGSNTTMPITVSPVSWMGAALFLAVALRLAPFPFHLVRPVVNGDKRIQPTCRTCLQIIPLAAGVWMLTQIQTWNVLPSFSLQLFSAVLLTGIVACGLLAWLPKEYPRVTRWIIAGQVGMTVMAALWAGPDTALAEGIALLLGGGLLIHYTGRDNNALENRIAVGVGIIALAGFPLTWGGDGRFALFNIWINRGQGLNLLLAGGSYLLLLGAAIKLILHAEFLDTDRLNRILVGIGFGLPAVGLFIRSGATAQQHFVVWLAILLPVGGGALLAWGAHSLQPLQQEIEPWLHNVLSLDWLAVSMGKAGRTAGQITHGIHQVLEGEGALLWVLAMLILGWLLMQIR
ncbi:MAG: hypothetical protein JXA42_15735 [Anaerolineales bacterium]|nr:hypothetical protein [Anaerolineales bacterium]